MIDIEELTSKSQPVKQKKKWHYLTIVVLFVIALAIYGWLAWQNQHLRAAVVKLSAKTAPSYAYQNLYQRLAVTVHFYRLWQQRHQSWQRLFKLLNALKFPWQQLVLLPEEITLKSNVPFDSKDLRKLPYQPCLSPSIANGQLSMRFQKDCSHDN